MSGNLMMIVCVVFVGVEFSQCQPTHMSDVCDASQFVSCIVDGAGLEMGGDAKLQGMKREILVGIVQAMVDLSRNFQTDSQAVLERKLGNLIDSAQGIRQNIRSLNSISTAEENEQGKTESNDGDITRQKHPLLPRFRVNHTLSFLPQAVPIWNDQLCLPVCRSSNIHVYNADTFAFQRTITVNGMKIPHDIVASENVLYVSEWEDKLIHRIHLLEESVSNWTVDGNHLTLSIAKNGNVIAASWRPAKILEYTSFGNLVREIVVNRFDANLIGLTHAIQMEGDKFLVCHDTTTISRVCIIDNTGRVIKCYGGNKRSGIGQLNRPLYLAIDRNEFILVADHANNRIVQLNSSLEYISQTVGIQKPWRILLNEERRRLYVIKYADKSLTVFDV